MKIQKDFINTLDNWDPKIKKIIESINNTGEKFTSIDEFVQSSIFANLNQKQKQSFNGYNPVDIYTKFAGNIAGKFIGSMFNLKSLNTESLEASINELKNNSEERLNRVIYNISIEEIENLVSLKSLLPSDLNEDDNAKKLKVRLL